MPNTKSPLRLDADLVAAATLAAPAMSRSVAQQIAHWARIGRELEQSPGVSLRAVAEVLRGAASYDALPAREQAVARALWAERLREVRSALRLDEEFAASGYRYAELDASGNVAVRGGPPARSRTGRRAAEPRTGAQPAPGSRTGKRRR
jgi:hypothetical protein